MSFSVLLVAKSTDPRQQATYASLESRCRDIVVVDGPDRAEALNRALKKAKHPTVLVLEAGETLEPASFAALEAFGHKAPLGAVCITHVFDAEVVREVTVRVARKKGARFEGKVTGRLVHAEEGAETLSVIVRAARVRAVENDRLRALSAEAQEHPQDGYTLYRLAEALVSRGPAEALEQANAALAYLPLDSVDAQGLVLTLASALSRLDMHEEILQLAEACRDRWPGFTELRYREALAHQKLGRAHEMLRAFEDCLQLGEDPAGPGTVGSGTFLPYYQIGLFCEAQGDRKGARVAYGRARCFAPYGPAQKRLEEIDRAAVRDARVPQRLSDDGAVAEKDCRHGRMAYPVNDSFVGRSLDLYGEWCEAEIDLFAALVEPGSVVVDVGANVGSHTVFFAKHVGPTGRVVALEPQSFVHELLVRNVRANRLTNVDCVRKAATDSPSTVRLPKVDPKTTCNFGAIAVTSEGAASDTESVAAVPLDTLGLEACDFLKIDVEGLETRVLAGAKRIISRFLPTIFVENNTVARSREILETVFALGYRAYWHVAPYYRSANYFHNDENVFSPYQPEANLVCVPVGRTLPGLVEASGPDDDFVKALARGAAEGIYRPSPRSGLAITSRAFSAPSITTSNASDAGQGSERPTEMPSALLTVMPGALSVSPTVAPRPAPPRRPLTIVACIPGREFSGRFFDAWNEFVEKCHVIGVKLVVSRRYDAVVYYARNKVAGGDVRRGAKQSPWGGELDYDYMLWIDSDVLFRFEDFQALLAHKVDMVAGLYLMSDNARFAAVERMDETVFASAGEFEFLTPAKMAGRQGLVPVDYCGFGFVLVRKGVFEKLEYPWFRPLYLELGGVSEFTAEDVGFCLMAKRAGMKMYVDPKVVVGHEKTVVFEPQKAA